METCIGVSASNSELAGLTSQIKRGVNKTTALIADARADLAELRGRPACRAEPSNAGGEAMNAVLAEDRAGEAIHAQGSARSRDLGSVRHRPSRCRTPFPGRFPAGFPVAANHPGS